MATETQDSPDSATVTNNRENSHNFKPAIEFTYSDFPSHFKVNSVMYRSNRSLNIPPGHTSGIWRLFLPGREGIWLT